MKQGRRFDILPEEISREKILVFIHLIQGQRFDGELHIVHYNTKYRRVGITVVLIVANILT